MPGATQRSKLPFNIVWKSLIFSFKEFLTIFKISFFPFLIIIAILIVSILSIMIPQSLLLDDLNKNYNKDDFQLVIYVLLIPFIVVFGSSIHGYIINREKANIVLFRIKWNEFVYFLSFLILYLILVISYFGMVILDILLVGNIFDSTVFEPDNWLLPGNSFDNPISFYVIIVPAALVSYLIVFRLILMLPHAAVTRRLSFGVAWRAVRGNFWRFFFATFLMFLLTSLLSVSVLMLLIKAINNFGHALASLSSLTKISLGVFGFYIFYAMLCAIWFAYLSYAYLSLVGATPKRKRPRGVDSVYLERPSFVPRTAS